MTLLYLIIIGLLKDQRQVRVFQQNPARHQLSETLILKCFHVLYPHQHATTRKQCEN